MNENKHLQDNDIEALSAIYGQDWSIIDDDNKVYSIRIKNDSNSNEEIKLEIRLPKNYPLSEPPCYTLSAPWMSAKCKSDLMAQFDDIYSKSKGDNIIYSWIEKCKEFLIQSNKNDSDFDNSPSKKSFSKNQDIKGLFKQVNLN